MDEFSRRLRMDEYNLSQNMDDFNISHSMMIFDKTVLHTSDNRYSFFSSNIAWLPRNLNPLI